MHMWNNAHRCGYSCTLAADTFVHADADAICEILATLAARSSSLRMSMAVLQDSSSLPAAASHIFGICRSFNLLLKVIPPLPPRFPAVQLLCHWVAFYNPWKCSQRRSHRHNITIFVCVSVRTLHASQIKFYATHTQTRGHIHTCTCTCTCTRWHSLTKWRHIKSVFKMRSGNCCMWHFRRGKESYHSYSMQLVTLTISSFPIKWIYIQ